MKSTLIESETDSLKDSSPTGDVIVKKDSEAKTSRPKSINRKSPKKSGIMIFEKED